MPYPIPKAPPRHTDLGTLGRWLPPAYLPYAQLLRLDRPAGYWLLVLPAWISLLLSADRLSFGLIGYLLLFLIGAVALRGAGCVINDLWDRELDRRVARTANRPLASGALSGRRALALLILLISLGVLVLLFLPWRVWGWALLSLPLITLYPLAKRFVPTPQVVLGLVFSWGALLGWLTLNPVLGWTGLWLYLAALSWILYYDTIYACQDRDDDARLHLNSMPLFLGDRLRTGLWVFMSAALLFWALALLSLGAGFFAWLGLGLVAILMAAQMRVFDPDDAPQCLAQFQGNVRIGQLWCAILAFGLIL